MSLPVYVTPTPIGGTVHARATTQATGLTLQESLVFGGSATNLAIASVVPETPGGGKTDTYRVIGYDRNGYASVSAAVSTADGADDLTGVSSGNLVTLTGAVPNVVLLEFYCTARGGATPSTTGLIGTVVPNAAGLTGAVACSFLDVGAARGKAFSATLPTPQLPTITAGGVALHPTGVQVALESAGTVYYTTDGSFPSATNGFTLPVLPTGLTFQLGADPATWANFRLAGTASIQCQFYYGRI